MGSKWTNGVAGPGQVCRGVVCHYAGRLIHHCRRALALPSRWVRDRRGATLPSRLLKTLTLRTRGGWGPAFPAGCEGLRMPTRTSKSRTAKLSLRWRPGHVGDTHVGMPFRCGSFHARFSHSAPLAPCGWPTSSGLVELGMGEADHCKRCSFRFRLFDSD